MIDQVNLRWHLTFYEMLLQCQDANKLFLNLYNLYYNYIIIQLHNQNFWVDTIGLLMCLFCSFFIYFFDRLRCTEVDTVDFLHIDNARVFPGTRPPLLFGYSLTDSKEPHPPLQLRSAIASLSVVLVGFILYPMHILLVQKYIFSKESSRVNTMQVYFHIE